MLCVSLKPAADNDARKLSNGDLRDDRPPHGRSLACHRGIRESIHIRRGGRASTDGLAARRRANAIAQNDEQPPCPQYISYQSILYC